MTRDPVPGPRWPSPVAAARFGADPLGFFPRLRERYGDVFRLSFPGFAPGVAVADPDLVELVFADSETFRAGPTNRQVFGFLDGEQALVCLDGEEHRKLRRVLGPVASWPRRNADLIERLIEEELARWPLEKAIATRPRAEPIVLDVVMRSSLGVGARQAPELAGAIHRVARLSRPLLPAPALRHNFGPLSPWARFQRARRQLVEMLEPLLSQPPSGDHALGYLVRGSAEDGPHLTIQQLQDQVFNLLMAGVETTSSSVAWAFERLATHPSAMREAQRLMRADESDYLDALARETLRVRPPFPHVWRMVARETQLDRYSLPVGSMVIIAIAALHMRPDLFPDPEAFRPERHLSGPARGWIPFGGGARACLGSTMARRLVTGCLSSALRRGAVAPGARKERPVQWGGTVLPSRGGRIQILTRG